MKISKTDVHDFLANIFKGQVSDEFIGTVTDQGENFLAKTNVDGEITKSQFDELGKLGDYTAKRSGAGIVVKVVISKELELAI
ncbi:hypothetical protein Q765_00395 [Flavobacterium rivuli WB 3.3-2 = DSM 21788]|uniref:Uncharacterized protein n=1 Tax=Flavobacterium rivuli WB 3.3-2 = DSM 21788 TaxID=1121895 RepID=A0A0A2M803_9FLAO|nr:hypothetical protein [Flavobacterium rivuli]KGO88409.1 hypothetical protein Q765_00395 [Flavobacterium rivuli WB 3.3-2 = DSM 21788]